MQSRALDSRVTNINRRAAVLEEITSQNHWHTSSTDTLICFPSAGPALGAARKRMGEGGWEGGRHEPATSRAVSKSEPSTRGEPVSTGGSVRRTWGRGRESAWKFWTCDHARWCGAGLGILPICWDKGNSSARKTVRCEKIFGILCFISHEQTTCQDYGDVFFLCLFSWPFLPEFSQDTKFQSLWVTSSKSHWHLTNG